MKVLLSIKPEYVDKILSGEKRFEFRKVSFSEQGITNVLIYATKPVGKLVGEFEVTNIHEGSPEFIWKLTKPFAGIEKKYFDSYYEGRNKAVAIAIGKVNVFETPMDLNSLGERITPPQSFCYIRNEVEQSQFEFNYI
ncbi:ASCH domain-containing protein [Pantoea agglomerans]|uniref:ASCH domain-containing protein n=1 Tax=Enterobacter agglomerans TaxID=549 RepID=UPI00177EB08E|nr:ASCH domain-containing protein [Pantoea agglomerans]MDY0903082.1 ASCH domain-containing protein [Pantoea agglomerans]WNK58187.1 ASCH domain-containing protein [Pantoea agglomerans]WVL89917.1 ASCH domain-containing protein [Pantoea agglomerans]